MTPIKKNVDQVLQSATEAFAEYRNTTGAERAAFLTQIATEIELLGDALITTVMEETFLPEARVRGEKGRTTNQILQFAEMVKEGSWKEVIIEVGNPNRQPLPKPDLRRMMVPMGPIVVFGAGNFPLAFSVAGGDTASVLAGGNPVVVKGHPAHPKTSRMVASAITKAVEKQKLPAGTFSFIEDSGHETGRLLVEHPSTKGVAFTGSEKGGRALYDLAAKREEPIPVFAEMGSINPVVVLPLALANKTEEIAKQLVSSLNMGVGQFCTNPGLILTTKTKGFDAFLKALSSEVMSATSGTMYHEGILMNYNEGAKLAFEQDGVESVSAIPFSPSQYKAVPSVGVVEGAVFLKNPQLHKEVFGPFSLVVSCKNKTELLEVIKALGGQLTTTIHGAGEEFGMNRDILEELSQICGRVLFNGVPTGVEVCPAMQHGGPYPAATDSRFTSVGTMAIKRFVRPVSFQDCPNALLPTELQNANPLNIWRQVNGHLTKAAIQ